MSKAFQIVRSIRRALGPWGEKNVNRLLYQVVYRLPMYRRQTFVNAGYLPLQDGFRPAPPFDEEPLQANLYEFAARTMVGDPSHAPRNIVELGSGRAAGTAYLTGMFPDAHVTAVEINGAAVRQARRRLGPQPRITLRIGDAAATGLPDAAFDFLVSVGTITYVGYIPFMQEAARLVKAGSYLALTGGVTGPSTAFMEEALTNVATFTGLKVVRFVDMTQNIFDALEADAPRREKLVAALPSFIRGYAREWSDLPGTERYENYRKGIRSDFGILLRR